MHSRGDEHVHRSVLWFFVGGGGEAHLCFYERGRIFSIVTKFGLSVSNTHTSLTDCPCGEAAQDTLL